MKLRILIKKVNTAFLANAKGGIGIELTRPIITMTYNQALYTFMNEVNTKFPLDIGGRNRSRRNVNEVNGRGSRGNRGGGGVDLVEIAQLVEEDAEDVENRR